jgi:exonuclease SbcC
LTIRKTLKKILNPKKKHRKPEKRNFPKIGSSENSKELSRFASELHDGENCPLCGSKEHPHIVEIQDVNTELQEIQESITALEEMINIQKQETEIEKFWIVKRSLKSSFLRNKSPFRDSKRY